MRKVQKILLGVFLGGVLLGGIGTGVAFLEYSSIAYAGERKVAQNSMVTENLDFPVDPNKGIVILEPVWYDDDQKAYLETDETVPEGIIRYRVTYNTKTIKPHLELRNYEEPEDEWEETGAEEDVMIDEETNVEENFVIDEVTGMLEEPASGEKKDASPEKIQGILFLERWYKDDFGLWMENKDQILSDLKKGQIASYRVDYITDIKILVNPATKPYVSQERN